MSGYYNSKGETNIEKEYKNPSGIYIRLNSCDNIHKDVHSENKKDKLKNSK